MRKPSHVTRRQMLGTLAVGAAGAVANDRGAAGGEAPARPPVVGDPRLRGPFPILSTPFTTSGAVDYEVLAKQARFVDWCGSPGMIWPQSNDSIELLTTEEKLRGMEVLAETMRGRKSALCLGVQGKDVAEMLTFARHAETLEPTALISRPPDSGKTEDDLRTYWRALAAVAKRPVILQTFGGASYKGPGASVKLMIELGKEFPCFGYVKEAVHPMEARIKEMVAAKPAIKCVYSAMGAFPWLFQSRIGTEGLITERAVYADLLALIRRHMESGNDPMALNDAYSKLLLMLNLRESIPGNQLRGYHLHVWKMRGVFTNMVSRAHGPNHSVPEKPILSEQKLTQEEIDEIERRFAALKPYLRPGTFEA